MYTRLGENLEHVDEADEVAAHYIDAIDQIVAAGITGEVSVKPTQLGLDLDADAVLRPPRPDRRARRGRRLVPVDRHGGQRLHRARRSRCTSACARSSRGPGSACRRTCGGPPPTSSGCARSTRRSAWSRAPTTRRSRSPTATGAASTRTSSGSRCRSCIDGRGRPIRLGLGTHDVALIEQIAEQVEAAGIGRDGFEVEMLYGDPDRPAVPPGEGGLSRPDAHRLR